MKILVERGTFSGVYCGLDDTKMSHVDIAFARMCASEVYVFHGCSKHESRASRECPRTHTPSQSSNAAEL